MTNKINRFNIRVYGILLHESEDAVLLTDEKRGDWQFTKFPGGGLEFGEGPIECVKREFLEELNQEVEVIRHFYTTDFFQRSAFVKTDQIISIYYLLKPLGDLKFRISEKAFEYCPTPDGEQCFRFKKINELKEEDLTFPIDKLIVSKLKELIK